MNKSKLFKQYRDYLILKNYSTATKRAYLNSLKHFFNFCQNHRSEFNGIIAYAKAYLLFRFNQGKSWRTVNIDYSSIKSLCEHVLYIDWDIKMIPRPRGEVRLPTVLSSQQLERMINQTQNLKHKTILIVFYSSGIRKQELINLQISDVLLDRMQLKINQGKGKKDRIINIPQLTCDVIKKYLEKYRPRKYLIESITPNKRYSATSIAKVIDQSAKRSKVLFNISTHSLRYAYATHHIENGTDLVTLQTQLGHKKIETTINYVSLCQIQNRHLNHPIENLNIEID